MMATLAGRMLAIGVTVAGRLLALAGRVKLAGGMMRPRMTLWASRNTRGKGGPYPHPDDRHANIDAYIADAHQAEMNREAANRIIPKPWLQVAAACVILFPTASSITSISTSAPTVALARNCPDM